MPSASNRLTWRVGNRPVGEELCKLNLETTRNECARRDKRCIDAVQPINLKAISSSETSQSGGLEVTNLNQTNCTVPGAQIDRTDHADQWIADRISTGTSASLPSCRVQACNPHRSDAPMLGLDLLIYQSISRCKPDAPVSS